MTNRGVTGAKRRSFHPVSLRSIAAQVMEDHRTAGRDELIRRALDVLYASPERDELLRSAAEAAFSNDFSVLLRDEKPPAPAVRLVTPAAKAERRATMDKLVTQAKRELKTIVEERARVMLLDLTMPTGKTLRESTFAECAEAGGWLTKVAALGKPDQIVGRVLNEDRLHAVYGD